MIVQGSEYIGTWLNNLKHGKGEEKWSDGSVYKGEYHEDKITGFGKSKFYFKLISLRRVYLQQW